MTAPLQHAASHGDDLPQGYKRTEVGVIPVDWAVKRLGAIALVCRGASPRPIDSPIWFDENSTVGWVRISDVSSANMHLHYTEQRLSALGIRHSRFVESNSLIMSICATVGRPIITKIDVCIHDGFVLFDNLNAHQLFLYYVLQKLEPDWSKFGQTGSQMNLNTGIINNAPVPLPPLPEQTAIATVLSDVDGLIASLTALIAKKRAVKHATMQQLLTGKTRLAGFTGAWEVKRLGEVCNFHKGKGLSKAEISNSGKYPCIHYGELFTHYKERIDCIASYCETKEKDVFSKNNDVLMPTSDVTPNGLATASCVQMDDVIIGGDVLIIRSLEQALDGVFLSYCISQNKKQILQLVTGSTVYHLYASDMQKFQIPLPPLPEQTAIVAILSDIDTDITTLETRLAKAKALKTGMCQELLTGKIRLL